MDMRDWLIARQDEMVALTGEFVSAESPSDDPALLAAAADLIASRADRLLGVPVTRLGSPGRPALSWSMPAVGCDARPVVLLAHLDTVWPKGTLSRWPFAVDGDRMTGPGVFDMKAGLVQALYALAALTAADADRPPLVLLVTADEEVGSPAGRAVIETVARDSSAVLVLEPSADGRLKVARKGVSNYDLTVVGRSAHAGLEPEKGINALVQAARLVLEAADLAAPESGTTVTPTLARAGTTRNTVPAEASIGLDVRAATTAEQERVDTAIRALRPRDEATVIVDGGINRPPLEERASKRLQPLVARAAEACGVPAPGTARVGGGSDGNLTAALGLPTLDGLGAVGASAHAEGEYALVSALPERAALAAALIVEIGREFQ